MLLMSLAFDNFELYNPTLSLELIVWSVCIGLAFGAGATYVNRRIVGGFVRRLVKDGANTPETAKTLSEAGYGRNIFVRLALKPGKPLFRAMELANADEMVYRQPSDGRAARILRRILSIEAEPKMQLDPDRARFYIPEEKRIAAELRYDAKGTTWPGLILAIILIIAMGFAVLYILPELFTFLDHFITLIEA